jgi:hypothetical protein
MDFFIDENFNYKQYSGKSILIIGGGPSTVEVNWKNIDVDFKWSCTNFFMNESIFEEKLDLISLGNLQDFKDRRLLDYLDTNPDCKVLFEQNYLYPATLYNNLDFINKYKNRIHYGQLEKSYTGIVGPPARMITLAAGIGFKNIYFVGLDGFDKDLKNAHAFTREDGLREGAHHNQYETYYAAHTRFANNIHRDFGDRVNFHNLGEAADSHNIISFVSKVKFPLTKQIYEKIK